MFPRLVLGAILKLNSLNLQFESFMVSNINLILQRRYCFQMSIPHSKHPAFTLVYFSLAVLFKRQNQTRSIYLNIDFVIFEVCLKRLRYSVDLLR